MNDERYDVVVIGAGQAGLAIGHFLAKQGKRFVIVEAADSVGSAWRSRWDSLVLFTPRRYDALPGLAFPGDPDGYPTRDEVIAYLEQYAQHFQLPIALSSPVRSLTREGDGVHARDRTRSGSRPVRSSWPPARSRCRTCPPLAADLAADVFQTHSTGYRRPADVPEGRVLVVGGGNTGFQIATELVASREVHLAIGSRQKPLPQRLLGRDLFWWLTKLGLLAKTVESRLGQRLRSRDTLIGSSPRRSQRHGVQVRPRAVRAEGRTIGFADGSELEVDAVIWATGYRPDHSWIELPVSTPTVVCATAAASPRCRGSTSSASPGNTPAARPCSASSPTTPRSSLSRSAAAASPHRRRTTVAPRRQRARQKGLDDGASRASRPSRPARTGP